MKFYIAATHLVSIEETNCVPNRSTVKDTFAWIKNIKANALIFFLFNNEFEGDITDLFFCASSGRHMQSFDQTVADDKAYYFLYSSFGRCPKLNKDIIVNRLAETKYYNF